ncbi:MAG: hypothetical protein ABI369_16320 [Acetobacteraceae bacterium]
MSREPRPPRAWRRRSLLTGAAGLAVTTGLGACATGTSAVGATANDTETEETPTGDPAGSLAFRSARNFGATAAPAGSTYSIFQAFTRGAVPTGTIARISARGRVVERQQCNNRVVWPDGSLRCATFIWSHPEAIGPGGRSRITIHAVPGRWDDTPSATLKDLLAHDYRMEVVIGDATYYLVANNEIRGAVRMSRIRAGSACTAWKIWGDFRAGTAPTDPVQGQMWGKMFLYVTTDGHIRIEDEIYCNKIANSAAIPVTSYALLDGGTVLFRHTTPFTLHTRNKIATYDAEGREYISGPDVSKVVWAFPRPMKARPTTTGLEDAMVVWPNEWTPAYIAAFPVPLNVAYAPSANLAKIFSSGIDGTGNHDFLGPMTSVAVMARLNGRYDYQRHDRLMALGSWGMCAYWCADAATGLPPVFTNKTYRGLSAPITNVGWGLAPTLKMEGGVNPGTTLDASHAGLWWWWQYLSTGSEQALENVMEQGVGVLGCDVAQTADYQRNPKFRNGKQYFGSYAHFPQPRAVGWEIRNLSNAHWVTPDAHPMKAYLNDLTQVQYDAAAELMAENAAAWGGLSAWYELTGEGDGYAGGYSPWMGDYRVTSILMDYRRGRIPLGHAAMTHVIRYQYGRMVDGSMRNGAGAYRLGTGVGPNPAGIGRTGVATQPAQTWADVYGFGEVPNIIVPLVDRAHETGDLRDVSSTAAMKANVTLPARHTYVGHTYPNLALCAGACGVIAGLGGHPKAVVAYLKPLIDNAPETLWGSTHAAQAWRIRMPT